MAPLLAKLSLSTIHEDLVIFSGDITFSSETHYCILVLDGLVVLPFRSVLIQHYVILIPSLPPLLTRASLLRPPFLVT